MFFAFKQAAMKGEFISIWVAKRILAEGGFYVKGTEVMIKITRASNVR